MLLLIILSPMLLDSWANSQHCERRQPSEFSAYTKDSGSGNTFVLTELLDYYSGTDPIFLEVEVFSDHEGQIHLSTSSSADRTKIKIHTNPEDKSELARQASFRSAAEPTDVEELPGYQSVCSCGYYNILDAQMDWTAGVDACRKMGTRMLLAESQAEIEALSKWAGKSVWFGVHRKSSSEPWINVLGKEVNPTDFIGWPPGPSSSEERQCMALDLSKPLKKMSNEPCDSLFGVICEPML